MLAEIVAIVILHSAKLSRTASEKTGTHSQTESINLQGDQKPSVAYTSLK